MEQFLVIPTISLLKMPSTNLLLKKMELERMRQETLVKIQQEKKVKMIILVKTKTIRVAVLKGRVARTLMKAVMTEEKPWMTVQ